MAGGVALRWARALTLASLMLGAGYSGHLAAGGIGPTTGLLGPILVVTTLAVAPFLDAPASARRVVVLVLTGQGVLHLVLELVGSASAVRAAPMVMPSTPGHEMAGMAPGVPRTALGFWAATLDDAHLPMLVVHGLAALVVALWLAAGERAAWTLVGLTTLLVARAWSAIRDLCVVTSTVVTARPRVSSPPVELSPVPRSVWDARDGLSRRGPPRACAAA